MTEIVNTPSQELLSNLIKSIRSNWQAHEPMLMNQLLETGKLKVNIQCTVADDEQSTIFQWERRDVDEHHVVATTKFTASPVKNQIADPEQGELGIGDPDIQEPESEGPDENEQQ